ncbi:APC family permease [Phytoactinopolyspora alkaliphila]|uniref:APC family permease n=1 Tax=Phytoactinopolyspora alkaliphila TaxID=1783498 RepID=A0A6N9YMD5_9ACTN|nr:APC family permease [Phytoactinopolyspora alkaliphila]NED96018.1 APC family permease [Phytoactinopolyspora alkaliphila]
MVHSSPAHEPPETRAQLSRTFRPSWIWAIALGSAVGWGAFVLPTDWMATAGPVGAVLGFAIGGVLMIVIAASYGILIPRFPVSGGEFAYAQIGFGRNHAVLCGWFLTLGYVCIVALNASALALLARYVLPQVAERGLLYEVAGWEVYLGEVLIASAALVVFAVLNIRGASLSGRLQFLFCLVMLAGVGVLLVAAILHPDGQLSNAQPAFPTDATPWLAVLAIVAIAPWAFVGFDNVPQAAEEFKFSPEKAFRLIVFAILAATVLYSAMIFTTAIAAPWATLADEAPLWGTGDAISDLLGGVGVMILAIAVSMGIFTGLNGFYVSASRLLFAMGRARMIPGVFARLHPRHGTPYIGLVFACAVCLIAPWFGREVLVWVVDMSAVGVTIAYTYTCLVAYRQLRSAGNGGRTTAARDGNTAAKLVVAALGTLIGLSFLALLLVPGSPAALGPQSLVALAIWVLLGLVAYLLRYRENSKVSDEELDFLVLGRERG